MIVMRILLMFCVMVLLGACGDHGAVLLPIEGKETVGPKPLDPGGVQVSKTVIVNPGDDEEECDPWLDPHWCQCEEQVNATGGHGSIGIVDVDASVSSDCFGDGGGGESGPGGGSGGGGDSGAPSGPPSLVNDEVVDAEPQPDCDAENLELQEQIWCEGDPPDDMGLFDAVAQDIIERCEELAEPWSRSRPNLRLFSHADYFSPAEGFGGAAGRDGNWILLSHEWVTHDLELALAHELLHVFGLGHPQHENHPDQTTPDWDLFVAEEQRCSGGRSALQTGPSA